MADSSPPPLPGPSSTGALAPHLDALVELVRIVDKLRDPDGCPWDRAQTPQTLRPFLLEEAHEVLAAIDAGMPEAVGEELGDLLFNVLLMARVASDQGWTDLSAVAGGIARKMRQRHPHVFAPIDAPVTPQSGGAHEIVAGWERGKHERRGGTGLLDGVPKAAPALLVAHRQGQKVSAVGFDWTNVAGVLNKVDEELGELREAIASGSTDAISHELGDVLMSLASLGRHLGTPAEDSLRIANARFARRFASVEALALQDGLVLADTPAPDLEALWSRAKSLEEA